MSVYHCSLNIVIFGEKNGEVSVLSQFCVTFTLKTATFVVTPEESFDQKHKKFADIFIFTSES